MTQMSFSPIWKSEGLTDRESGDNEDDELDY